jgi:hypothetical protein
MTVAVDRPIFLIGTGRCGSSLLLQLLGYHPGVAWMSHYTSRLPGGAAWAALSRVHDLPFASRLLARQGESRFIPQPTESYRLLRRATDGLFTAPRELAADEMTPDMAERLRAMAHDHCSAQGKPRFLMKHTGFGRVAWLRAAFPDARFVHVERDGRAVAASLCQVDWWSGEAQWGWGPLTAAQRDAYRASGFHELVLAAIYWEVLMDQLHASIASAPDHVLTVRYDQMVADPPGTLARILDFVDLPPDERFTQRVAATPMTSDDTRWRKRLAPADADLLERTLAPALARFGFATDRPAMAAP